MLGEVTDCGLLVQPRTGTNKISVRIGIQPRVFDLQMRTSPANSADIKTNAIPMPTRSPEESSIG